MREIPPSEWCSFLERFSREHRAWLATTHCVGAGHAVTRASSSALESVTVERRVPDGAVRLRFLDGRSLRAGRPRAVRVEQTDTGAERALEIDTSQGTLVRIAFRATALPEHLDGMAPGEVNVRECARE